MLASYDTSQTDRQCVTLFCLFNKETATEVAPVAA